MKSRRVKRFLAILGACVITVTSMPLSVSAAETVSENNTEIVQDKDAGSDKAADKKESSNEVKATSSPEATSTPTSTVTPTETPSATEDPEATSTPSSEVTPSAVPTETPAGEEVPTETPTSVIDAITKSATDKVSSVAGAVPTTTPVADGEVATVSEGGIVDEEALTPGTPTISSDSVSGLNIYNPVISEFTTSEAGEGLLVTGFTPSLSQSYDLVLAPSILNGKSASYGSDFLTALSKLGKGVVFDSGAELVTSTQNLKIPYVRFNEGALTSLSSQVFKGWDRLTAIVGYGEALVSAGASDVSFTETFSGCKNLKDVTLNLSGLTASFDNTFSGINGINTITVKGCHVNFIRLLNPIDSENVWLSLNECTAKPRTVTFSDVTFPDNDSGDYLDCAFTNMPGNVIFNNCTSNGVTALNFNNAYIGSNLMSYDSGSDGASNSTTVEPGGTYHDHCSAVDVRISGVTAYSAKSMFENSQLKNVSLQGFITSNTIAIDKMFKGSTIADIGGADSWRIGTATADEMFFNTRVYFGPFAYLTKTLIPTIKRWDWSDVTSANKLFKFIYKADCPIDYSGMDLSGITDFTVSDLPNYDFISPAKSPQNFVFEQDNVYVLRAGSDMGGKALDPVEVTGGKVVGSEIAPNTRVYTDIATISVTDVTSGDEVSTPVVPGFKLSEYLDSSIKYYQDRSLTQAVAGDLVINSGDNVSVYFSVKSGGVTEDIMTGADIDLGSNLGDVNIKLEDGTTDKLQGGNADVNIKIESNKSGTTGKLPSGADAFAKSAFFDIDLVATIGGSSKKVTELSKKATVTLPLPSDYTSGDVMVLNYHDGLTKDPIVLAATVNTRAKTVSFDTDKFSPYVMLYNEDTTITRTTQNVTVDLSNLTSSDILELKWGDGILIQLFYKYEDGSEVHLQERLKVENQSVYKYTVKYEVPDQSENGSKFKEFTNIDTLLTCKGKYESVVDLNTMTLSFNPVAEDSKETTNYNFAVKVVDNSNATKSRPDTLEIKFTAKYDTYSRDKRVSVNLKGISGNVANGTVEFPTNVGGKTMTSLEATTTTATNIGYSSTWDQAKMLFKYTLAGASDTEPDPGVVIDPARVAITFVGDIATSRPSSITITMADSKGGNVVTKVLNTAFSAGTYYYSDTFERLVNDTYHVTGVSGIDATKYKVEYSGLNITATYTAGNTTTKATRKVTIEMDDNNDEAGIRPKTMKVKIANNSGSWSSTNEITVGSSNSFTYDAEVPDASGDYKITGVEGLPDGYKTEISGLTVKCKYTPEKIQKTYKVEWTGDGDDADKTRPGSVQITVKNGGSTVQTVTVSKDTNWSANVSLNKMIKGVEASYSIEGADVTNYSKSVSGDTITYKFTGTLSKDAAAIEANKNGTTNGATVNGTGVEEASYDIANFDWIDYANKYPDLKKAYGYNKEALYAHYIRYGIGEGRVATFTGKYATVNEDVLKAYFPDDYKYKTNLSSTNEEYNIGKDTTSSSTTTKTDTSKVTVDDKGNVHTTVKNADGTTTETVTDADGNIISVSTYKTGDLRLEDMSTWFIVLGVLLLAIAAMIIRVVIRDDKRKKSVLSMIS